MPIHECTIFYSQIHKAYPITKNRKTKEPYQHDLNFILSSRGGGIVQWNTCLPSTPERSSVQLPAPHRNKKYENQFKIYTRETEVGEL